MKKYNKYIVVLFFLFVILVFNFKFDKIYNKDKNEKYPNKKINLIVPYKKGGGTDISTKVLAKAITQKYNVDANIQYIKSEIGFSGYKKICNADANGYTLGIINVPNFINTSIKNNEFYSEKGMTPIMNFSYDPCVFVVKKGSEFDSIEHFINKAKNNPDKIRVSSNGIGSSNYIAGQDFFDKASIEVVNVPFNGSKDMLRAVEEGYVSASVAKLSEVLSDKNEADFKILATFTKDRLDKSTTIPTLLEKGYDVFHGSHRAVVGPKGLDKSISNKIYKMIENSLNTDFGKKEAIQNNIIIDIKKPKELTTIMQDEEKRIREFIMEID